VVGLGLPCGWHHAGLTHLRRIIYPQAEVYDRLEDQQVEAIMASDTSLKARLAASGLSSGGAIIGGVVVHPCLVDLRDRDPYWTLPAALLGFDLEISGRFGFFVGLSLLWAGVFAGDVAGRGGEAGCAEGWTWVGGLWQT
jgi:hypothetical protein